MKKVSKKNELKRSLNRLFRSMDFVSKNFLNNDKLDSKTIQIYWNIYQQLGIAWEFLGLQCEHWDGYKKIRDKKEVCKICGKVKSADEFYYLLTRIGTKKIGKRLTPNSDKTFPSRKKAQICKDTINFHGAEISVDVHNSYKSRLFSKTINIAAERCVSVKEKKIECNIYDRLISLELNVKGKKTGRKTYGNFPWELRRQDLKNFPVIFDFDEKFKMLGLTILT